jgi:DNA-directed RNA polymerase specialized sigma24 family protein
MRDRQSLEDLYDRHAPCLYAVALRITADQDAAADALEAAFVALAKTDDIRDPAAFLVHATRDYALARQSRLPATAVVPPVTDPRRVVEDAWYGGLTVTDLAARHGVSEEDARGLLYEGMAALRSQVARTK